MYENILTWLHTTPDKVKFGYNGQLRYFVNYPEKPHGTY